MASYSKSIKDCRLEERRYNVRVTFAFVAVLLLGTTLGFAEDEVTEFYGYVDSNICSRLHIGTISASRVECTKDTYKNGNNLVLLRLEDNMVLEPKKEKKVKPHVAKTVRASGKVKEDKGEVKLETIEQIGMAAIPRGEVFSAFDVRNVRGKDTKATWERVRHQLAIMPYLSVFDFISFAMVGNDVILTGWTIRTTNRTSASRIVQGVEGVESVINNIEILPLGGFDMDIRAGTRAALQRFLPSYFWGSGSNIRIVVRNGDIILLGTVRTQTDKDVANIQSRAVPGAFHVFNLLQVKSSEKDEG